LQASIQQLTQVAAHGAHAQREGLDVLKTIADGDAGSDKPALGQAPAALSGPTKSNALTTEDGEAMNAGLETAVSNGFSDMSRAMETAFIGYAQLLHRSMAVRENTAGEQAAMREGTNG
jgi:hypothetical protein